MFRGFRQISTGKSFPDLFGGGMLRHDVTEHVALVAVHHNIDTADIEVIETEEDSRDRANMLPPVVETPPPDPDQDAIDAVLAKVSGDVTAADVKRALLADLRKRHGVPA